VTFSEPMSATSLKKRDLFVVAIELVEDDERSLHPGLRSHILPGNVTPAQSNRVWTFVPQPQVTADAVNGWRGRASIIGIEDIRLRVTLKAHGLFSERGPYLNGKVLWAEGAGGRLSKAAREADPHEGGDFESWAFLRVPQKPPHTGLPTFTLTQLPTFTLTRVPTFTVRPVGVTRLPVFEPTFHPGPVPHLEGVLPLSGVDIADAGGDALVHVGNETARPTVAAEDSPAALELELGATLADDRAIAFVESLRVVDSEGKVVSGTPEFLGGNRVRIPVEGTLESGDYVVVPGGQLAAEPAFGFSVS
jgi:hypothetical protein